MVSERVTFMPATVRSRLMLEVASELVDNRAWPYPQVRISMRKTEADGWPLSLFASDSPTGIDEVASSKATSSNLNSLMVRHSFPGADRRLRSGSRSPLSLRRVT